MSRNSPRRPDDSHEAAASEGPPSPSAAEVMREWTELMPGVELSGLAIAAQTGRMHVLITRLLNEIGKAHGVNSIDIAILMAIRRLSRERPTRPTELWRLFDLTAGAITYRINRLSDLGLVARLPDGGDGRVILVTLTPLGLSTIDMVSQAYAAAAARRMAAVRDVPGGPEMLGWLLDRLLVGWESEED
jgi:DNA-binding MarR family transcriptional regulator